VKDLTISEGLAGDVAVLELHGNIMIGSGTALLHQTIRRLLAGGRVKFILNLADIRWVDSCGLGALVAAYTAIARAGGQIKFSHVRENVQEIMAITKLVTVFDIYEDAPAALRDFR